MHHGDNQQPNSTMSTTKKDTESKMTGSQPSTTESGSTAGQTSDVKRGADSNDRKADMTQKSGSTSSSSNKSQKNDGDRKDNDNATTKNN